MAIIIDLKLNMQGVSSKFNKFEAKVVTVKGKVDELNKSLTETLILSNSIADAWGRMRAPGGPRGPRGPGQSGNGQSIQDAYDAYERRRQMGQSFKEQYEGKFGKGGKPPVHETPDSFGKVLMNALMRSRISASGGLMPLVGDLVKVLSFFGPEVAFAGQLFYAASKTITAALDSTNEYLSAVRASQVSGGGSFQQANAGVLLQQSLGINPGQIGKGLMSGYGPIAAAGAGVSPFGGPFGNNNYNEKGLKVLDWIRSSRDLDQARRRSELAGSPEAAQVHMLTNTTYQMLRNPSNAVPGQQAGISAEFTANMGIFANNFQQLLSVFSGPVMSIASDGLKALNIAFTQLAPAFKILGEGLDILAKSSGLHMLLDLVEAISGNGGDSHKDAVKRNTDAVEDLTKTMREGVYGGGPNAQSALPGSWSPVNPTGQTNLPYGIAV
jgi:hypothetical protein